MYVIMKCDGDVGAAYASEIHTQEDAVTNEGDQIYLCVRYKAHAREELIMLNKNSNHYYAVGPVMEC